MAAWCPIAAIGQPYPTGRFLPFEFYGATGNAQAYGYKEEQVYLMIFNSDAVATR